MNLRLLPGQNIVDGVVIDSDDVIVLGPPESANNVVHLGNSTVAAQGFYPKGDAPVGVIPPDRSVEIKSISDKLDTEFQYLANSLKMADERVKTIMRLRANLYGILDNTEPKIQEAATRSYIERQMVKSIVRRYSVVTTDDLASKEQLADARKVFGVGGDVEFDEDALISQDEHGNWIQGWFWIPD